MPSKRCCRKLSRQHTVRVPGTAAAGSTQLTRRNASSQQSSAAHKFAVNTRTYEVVVDLCVFQEGIRGLCGVRAASSFAEDRSAPFVWDDLVELLLPQRPEPQLALGLSARTRGAGRRKSEDVQGERDAVKVFTAGPELDRYHLAKVLDHNRS